MIVVSDDFKTAASAPVKSVRGTVIIDPDGDNPVTLTSADRLVSFSVESSGELFGSVSSATTIKLLGTDFGDLIGKKIRIFFELKVAEDRWEAVHYGYFKVTEQPMEKGSETTTIKGISIMGVLQGYDYEPDITYPISIANLAAAIAAKYSLQIGDMSQLPNADYEIREDLYENISGSNYRSILAEIAGATASMAYINNVSQQINFRPPQTAVQGSLDYDTLKSLEINQHYGPVNSVVLARTPQEDNIATSDDESIEEYGLTEVKLANNEIMDDERTVFIGNIFNAVDGLEWTGFEATTVGHGWYEIGDRLSITDDQENTIEGIITYSQITIDGGIKETIKGIIPEKTTTDYAVAGGVLKTIYNTEIKVDKQNQQIQSTVAELTQFEGQTNENFTQVSQNISSVVTSVQNSGGNNLIKNSAMYIKESDGTPTNWALSGTGTWSVSPSADAEANGSLSGQVISLANKTVTQIVTVKPDDDSIPEDRKTYYSFSCKIKKTAIGGCSVTLSDGTQDGIWRIELGNGEASNYGEYAIEAILPHSTELSVAVTASQDAEFYITDMMLAVGNLRSQWTQANGEFSNSSVQIDSDGVTIKNSNLSGAYTKMTPQNIEIYKNNQLAANMNSNEVLAKSGSFKDRIEMPPLKIVPQSDGWAVVKRESN